MIMLVVVGFVGWASGFPLGGAAAFWTFAGAALAAWLVHQSSPKPGRSAFEAAAQTARSDWNTVATRWSREAGDETFSQKRAQLENARQEYLDLGQLKQRKLEQLRTNVEKRQRDRFLDRHRIAHADISGIGQVRAATLLSYGIETAAEVTPARILAVPGFGDVLTNALLSWRRTVERRFQFDPRVGVDPADVAQVEGELASKKADLEKVLRAGAAELRHLSQQAMQRRQTFQSQVDAALVRFAQAEADLKAA
jgi:DNA-binding helix-hairpin-helix protein with protein kinase domain